MERFWRVSQTRLHTQIVQRFGPKTEAKNDASPAFIRWKSREKLARYVKGVLRKNVQSDKYQVNCVVSN